MVILKLKKIHFTAIKVLFLGDVDINNILGSNKISFGEKKTIYTCIYTIYKLYIPYIYHIYIEDYEIKPLHIMIPKTKAYVKSYDSYKSALILKK